MEAGRALQSLRLRPERYFQPVWVDRQATPSLRASEPQRAFWALSVSPRVLTVLASGCPGSVPVIASLLGPGLSPAAEGEAWEMRVARQRRGLGGCACLLQVGFPGAGRGVTPHPHCYLSNMALQRCPGTPTGPGIPQATHLPREPISVYLPPLDFSFHLL